MILFVQEVYITVMDSIICHLLAFTHKACRQLAVGATVQSICTWLLLHHNILMFM